MNFNTNIKKESYWKNIHLFNNFFLSELLKNRKKIHKIFLDKIQPTKKDKILDIGATPTLDKYENFFVNQYPWKNNITCLSNVNCNILKSKFPEINVLIGDGKKTNLSKNSFDIVYSSAVIEHVGNFTNQVKFIKECIRLSKKKIFISTPNRYFPLDFHTKLPMIHMLPKNIHRKILKLLGDDFFQYEKNLNLLSKNDLIKICQILNVKKYTLVSNKILCLKSNLLLIIENN